jgi:hypothetical protein
MSFVFEELTVLYSCGTRLLASLESLVATSMFCNTINHTLEPLVATVHLDKTLTYIPIVNIDSESIH